MSGQCSTSIRVIGICQVKKIMGIKDKTIKFRSKYRRLTYNWVVSKFNKIIKVHFKWIDTKSMACSYNQDPQKCFLIKLTYSSEETNSTLISSLNLFRHPKTINQVFNSLAQILIEEVELIKPPNRKIIFRITAGRDLFRTRRIRLCVGLLKLRINCLHFIRIGNWRKLILAVLITNTQFNRNRLPIEMSKLNMMWIRKTQMTEIRTQTRKQTKSKPTKR